jgi:hypothetical protein
VVRVETDRVTLVSVHMGPGRGLFSRRRGGLGIVALGHCLTSWCRGPPCLEKVIRVLAHRVKNQPAAPTIF